MKKKKWTALLSVLLVLLLLAGCAGPAPEGSSTAPPQGSSAEASTPVPAGAPALEDDFYEAVNAEWLAQAQIPSDMPVAGGFMDLNDGVEDVLMADFEAMLAGDNTPEDTRMQHMVEYYRLARDMDTRNAAGAAPLAPYLEMVEQLDSLQAYADGLAEWDLASMPLPFAAGTMADMGNASTYALYLMAPSLFLMDKGYYEDAATKEMLQGAYAEMSTALLVLAGKTAEEAAEIAQGALAFDESLAPHTRSAEEASDYTKMYNPMPLKELDAQVAAFDLTKTLTQLLGRAPETVVVTDPAYFAALDQVVNDDSFEDMKDWMLVQTVGGFAGYLSEEFRVQAGSFDRLLSGTTEATDPETAAFYLATSAFGEVVGLYYGQTYFGEEAKQDVTEMVASLVRVYEQRLAANNWLGDATRDKAIEKLRAMTVNVGYPDQLADIYDQLMTTPQSEGGTLLGNALGFTRLLKEYGYARWNQPVDRGEWPLSAHTVNAMYSPMNNSINFPAAILQAPFYSKEQSEEANLGGIGAVIAHEISHAFDPNGAKFDELGNLAEWWTEEDHAQFEVLSAAMVAQFDGLEYAGGTVNGTLTVSENVADAGGLSCALEAASQLEAPDLDAFFKNWAVIWRQKATPEYEAMLLSMDVHAPNKLRANIQLQNLDAFFETYNITEGDGMYRAPADRVGIW